MSFTSPFGDLQVPDTTDIDPDVAIDGLKMLFSTLGEAQTGDPITQATTQATQTKDTTSTAAAPTTGKDRSAPVPEGTAVSQGFGAGNDHDQGGHPGIDFAVPLDSQLLAAASGTVTHAANDDPGGYGEWVEITTPDGIAIRYGHLHGTSVQVGQKVSAGQVIGTSGGEAGGPTSGNSSGAHLHFEVRANGQAVDPTPFLAGGYNIVGGAASSKTPQTADPKAIAAAQVQNVLNTLTNKPTTDTQTAEPASAGGTGDFAADVLQGIGAPVTAENTRFIQAWMKAEGGESHNNPLNTTQGAAGASDFNSVGVKTYTSYQQGVQATIQTLMNGYYGGILAALMRGSSAEDAASALAASPWGTGPLVQQILGGK